MDPRIACLTTPEECDQVALNARDRFPELELAALRRGVELRAQARAAALGATRTVEREALQAIYAYEGVLFKRHGKVVHASRTWQMIDRHGIIGAVERAVDRPNPTSGYRALAEMGLMDFAFEAVILRHPECFSAEAVMRSEERLREWRDSADCQRGGGA